MMHWDGNGPQWWMFVLLLTAPLWTAVATASRSRDPGGGHPLTHPAVHPQIGNPA